MVSRTTGNIVVFDCVQMYFILLSYFKHNGLRVFENKVLRRIFGPRRDEVTGE